MDKTLVKTEKSAGAVVRGCSVKKYVLKNFAKFTGKYLCWSLFLMKFQALRSGTLLKYDSNTVFLCKFDKIFQNTYFVEYLQTAAFESVRCLVEILLSKVRLEEEEECTKII